MPNAEHVIALVTKLEDRSSTGFDQVAAAAERSAERIARATQKVNAAATQATGARGGTGLLSAPGSFMERIDRLSAERSAMLAKAERLQVNRVGLIRQIERSTSTAQLAAAGRALDEWSQKVQAAATRTASSERAMVGPLGRMGSAVKSFALGFVGGIAGGLVFALQDQLRQVIFSFDELSRRAEDLGNLSIKTNLSVEALQTLDFAAKQMGVSFDSVRIGSRYLARQIADDSNVLKAMGIATRTVDGSLRSVEDVMLDVATAYQHSTDETSKLAIATTLFGRSGAELIPFLELGAEGIRKFQERAKATGNVIEKENIAKLRALDEQLDQIKAKWSGFTLFVKLAVAKEVGSALGVDQVQEELERQRNLAIDQARRDEFRLNAARRVISGQPAIAAIFDAAPLKEFEERVKRIAETRTKIAQGIVREFGQDDLPMNERLAQTEEDRVANARSRAEAEAKAAEQAERHDQAVQRMTARLEASDMGAAQANALAIAFAEGRQSVESLMVKFKDNETVVGKIVDQARVLRDLTDQYKSAVEAAFEAREKFLRGDTSRAREIATEAATQGKVAEIVAEIVGSTEQAVTKEASLALLRERGLLSVEGQAAAMKEINDQLDAMVRRSPTPVFTVDRPVPTPPPPRAFEEDARRRAPLGSVELAKFLAAVENTATDAMTFWGAAWEAMTSNLDRAVERWTQRVIVFRGFFGDTIRALVEEALKQLGRLAVAKFFDVGKKLFDIALGFATGGPPGAVGGAITGGSGGGGGGSRMPVMREPAMPGPFSMASQGAGTARLNRGGVGDVSRATSAPVQNIQLTVNALSYGTVLDRVRSPFGEIRWANEAEIEAGRV